MMLYSSSATTMHSPYSSPPQHIPFSSPTSSPLMQPIPMMPMAATSHSHRPYNPHHMPAISPDSSYDSPPLYSRRTTDWVPPAAVIPLQTPFPRRLSSPVSIVPVRRPLASAQGRTSPYESPLTTLGSDRLVPMNPTQADAHHSSPQQQFPPTAEYYTNTPTQPTTPPSVEANTTTSATSINTIAAKYNLIFQGMLSAVGDFRRIRVWKSTKGLTFYDCTCGKRRPDQGLKKIKHHASRHTVQLHACDECGKVYRHHCSLNAHKRVHKKRPAPTTDYPSSQASVQHQTSPTKLL